VPYNIVGEGFHTKNFAADFLQAKRDFTRKTAVLRFEPQFRGCRGNVRCSSRLIRMRVVEDFLLVLTEFLGVTAEALRAKID